MFVPCPHCGFLVALIVARPDAAQRCPRCGQPLQLQEAPADERARGPADTADTAPTADTADAATGTGAAPGASTQAETAPTDGAAAPPAGREIEPADAAAVAEPVTAPAPRAPVGRAARPQRATPSFARRSVSMLESGRRWPGAAAIAVLLVALVLQLLLAQRHALAADAGWRPTISALCGAVGCQLPPWREPEAFTMLAREVRPVDSAGVLQVRASFRNDARWPQPWPRLLLRLNDRHGRTVGARLFASDEYLDRRMSTPELLAPGQSASVDFAVREPAAEIVAFDFDFR